jgi:excinuclease ABC subunit A
MQQFIRVRGARQHNLKNVNLDIPKNKLVVFTGVSGSGKTSLAFDTIYAEGQRRYVESLSTYARQFLGVMDKPDVDLIEGLSPAISIDQKTISHNPRSTVGTITEIYDYLRLLFARIGHPHCPICGREISRQSVDEIVGGALKLIESNLKSKKIMRFFILSPLVRERKGEFTSLFANLKAKGYREARIDGFIKSLDEDLILIKTNKHSIEVVVDKFSLSYNDFKNEGFFNNFKSRLNDSISQALNLSEGNIILSEILDRDFTMNLPPKEFKDHLFSELFACPVDNIQISEIEPRTFSFNSPFGACPDCSGLGKVLKIDPQKIFAFELSITEGGILPFSRLFEKNTWYSRIILEVCKENGINPKEPIKNYSKEKLDLLLYGTGEKTYRVEGTNRWGQNTTIWEKFNGLIADLEEKYSQSNSDYFKQEIERYMREEICQTCKGTRLKKEALSITIAGNSIADITSLSIANLLDWIKKLPTLINQRERDISNLIVKEITERLTFLNSVGVEYLSLSRSSSSLSGGEAQRIRLASQIGSGLTGVLYVLDEPTIGLHQRDNQKLIDTLKKLRDLDNTVIVVEHDREMIEQSDWVIDFGPEAGDRGGRVVFEGTPEEINKFTKSQTGLYLSNKKIINIPKSKAHAKGEINLIGASRYNLKNINVSFPLGKMVVITGVSGSGKSTLLVDTLYPALVSYLDSGYLDKDLQLKDIKVNGKIDKVILIDQSPIGRTPRSNPATYTKVFDLIRDVFANTREAKAMGFKKGRFSFNVKGGRCEVCEGQGQIKIEMQFMSDIWITCDVCHGKRYNNSTLEVTFRGKNIAEVLDMSVDEALEYFHSYSQIIHKLETLKEVGLGYIKLGQPATTLSGGEAQRVKLAAELSKKATGSTVYILDEPTTGLHFADVEKLLRVLRLLVERGNSVFMIEHNLDVIKNADYIIDLGPEGGEKGGYILAQGTEEEVKKAKNSYTAKYL